MNIIASINVKGGTGKTTTVVNLSHALALAGHKVLVVDFDPQGNTTAGLGVDAAQKPTVYHAIKGTVKTPECFTEAHGMTLLPADLSLADAEIMVGTQPGREHRLRAILEDFRDEFQYCLIDCPPTAGFFTLNAMVAADYLLIPVETQFLPLRGVEIVMGVLNSVRKYLHPDLQILGVLATKYDQRRSLDQVVLDRLRKVYQREMFKTVIRTNADLAGAAAVGQPVLTFAPNSNGAKDYQALAQEVIDRTGGWL